MDQLIGQKRLIAVAFILLVLLGFSVTLYAPTMLLLPINLNQQEKLMNSV